MGKLFFSTINVDECRLITDEFWSIKVLIHVFVVLISIPTSTIPVPGYVFPTKNQQKYITTSTKLIPFWLHAIGHFPKVGKKESFTMLKSKWKRKEKVVGKVQGSPIEKGDFDCKLFIISFQLIIPRSRAEFINWNREKCFSPQKCGNNSARDFSADLNVSSPQKLSLVGLRNLSNFHHKNWCCRQPALVACS